MSTDEETEENPATGIAVAAAKAATLGGLGAVGTVLLGPLGGIGLKALGTVLFESIAAHAGQRQVTNATTFVEETIQLLLAAGVTGEEAEALSDEYIAALESCYRTAASSLDPTVVAALARLAHEYRKKPLDSTFRRVGRFLERLTKAELAAARAIAIAIQRAGTDRAGSKYLLCIGDSVQLAAEERLAFGGDAYSVHLDASGPGFRVEWANDDIGEVISELLTHGCAMAVKPDRGIPDVIIERRMADMLCAVARS